MSSIHVVVIEKANDKNMDIIKQKFDYDVIIVFPECRRFPSEQVYWCRDFIKSIKDSSKNIVVLTQSVFIFQGIRCYAYFNKILNNTYFWFIDSNGKIKNYDNNLWLIFDKLTKPIEWVFTGTIEDE